MVPQRWAPPTCWSRHPYPGPSGGKAAAAATASAIEAGKRASKPLPQSAWSAWWQWNAYRVILAVIYFFGNVFVYVYGYVTNMGVSTSPYYPLAKGFGKMLDVNCSFILLPVLRNILSWMRSTPVADVIPLDDNILMHKTIAWVIAAATLGHITFHYLNFAFSSSNFGDTIIRQALLTFAGATGHIIVLLMLIMFATAWFMRTSFKIGKFRFDGYAVFLICHKLWMPVFVILCFHATVFWTYCLWPVIFMILEKIIQARRSKVDVMLVDAKMTGKDVMKLTMTLKTHRKFIYQAGQYLFLNCPEISDYEYHPFTITSAPEEAAFTVHIRCRADMDWTHRLRTLTFPAGSQGPAPAAEVQKPGRCWTTWQRNPHWCEEGGSVGRGRRKRLLHRCSAAQGRRAVWQCCGGGV